MSAPAAKVLRGGARLEIPAFTCCTVPKSALSSSTAKITRVLSPLPDRAEITAAAKRIATIRS